MNLTDEQWEELWQVIATVRDRYPRDPRDIDSAEIVDSVVAWLEMQS